MTRGSNIGAIMSRAELRPEFRAEQIMSMPVLRSRRWTVEDLEQLIHERPGLVPRYEPVGGELLVTPAPTRRHQRLVFQLALLLQRYLTRHGIGEVTLGPAELKLVQGERYEPDLFVIAAVDRRRPAAIQACDRPLLICESLSPGSARHDRFTKRRSFQRNAVPEYWIVDGDAKAIEVCRPDDERPVLVDDRLVWTTSAPEPFELDVQDFFASVEDDGRCRRDTADTP